MSSNLTRPHQNVSNISRLYANADRSIGGGSTCKRDYVAEPSTMRGHACTRTEQVLADQRILYTLQRQAVLGRN